MGIDYCHLHLQHHYYNDDDDDNYDDDNNGDGDDDNDDDGDSDHHLAGTPSLSSKKPGAGWGLSNGFGTLR